MNQKQINSKVNFFIIGTQKGGTTALHYILSCVQGIQMSRPKEIHFFDNDSINWCQVNYDKLHECFDWSIQNQIRGEATPIYCYWPDSIQRIHAYNSEAKIIMLLRHPAFRAYSQWRMEFRRGNEDLQFEDAISKKGRLRMAGDPRCVHRIYSYVDRGYYSMQIRRLKELFCDNQLIFLRTDELWTTPQKTIEKITRTLGVSFSELISTRYLSPSFGKINEIPAPAKPLNLLSQLTDRYSDDIIETERLTGIYLSDWLYLDYQEPMPPYIA